MFMRLIRQTFRIDDSTEEALRQRAMAEHKKVPDLVREGIRLRLEIGTVSDLIRVVVAEVVAHAQMRIDAMGAEWRERLIESEQRERALTRADIDDFIAGLNQYEQASRAPASSRAPAPMSAHDQLSK